MSTVLYSNDVDIRANLDVNWKFTHQNSAIYGLPSMLNHSYRRIFPLSKNTFDPYSKAYTWVQCLVSKALLSNKRALIDKHHLGQILKCFNWPQDSLQVTTITGASMYHKDAKNVGLTAKIFLEYMTISGHCIMVRILPMMSMVSIKVAQSK